MRAEHCHKAGADLAFTSTNYGIATTPRREWAVASGEAECPESDRGHGRVVPRVGELRRLPAAAGLADAEILALVLYTGPMFQVYNSVLRRWPADVYEPLRAGGNLFPTTVHVLVSAVQKIARSTELPEGLLLYRGLGGARAARRRAPAAAIPGCDCAPRSRATIPRRDSIRGSAAGHRSPPRPGRRAATRIRGPARRQGGRGERGGAGLARDRQGRSRPGYGPACHSATSGRARAAADP